MFDVQSLISARVGLHDALEANASQLSAACELIIQAFLKNRKLLICGNGGSAADAQHMAAEFVGRFKLDRRPLAAIALSTDTSILTAIANDFGYEHVFRKQIEALGESGDVLIAISTSGMSSNVIEAVAYAKLSGIKVVSLVGRDGGSLKDMADVVINSMSDSIPIIQERHLCFEHMICEAVELGLKDYGVL